MHDARGCDDLIGGVAVKIQSFNRTADVERQWPSINTRQCSSQLGVIQVELDATQFGEFSDFPNNDCGNTPGVVGEQLPFPMR